MRFYSNQQCHKWLADRRRQLPSADSPLRRERLSFSNERRSLYWTARWIASTIGLDQMSLLWIVEWDIWPNSENWHLYYKLRQSYLDPQLLNEAPGHLFLKHENEDLASFLQLAMLNGWGGYLLTELDYVSLFFSHDGYIDFYADRDGNLDDVRKTLMIKGDPSPSDGS